MRYLVIREYHSANKDRWSIVDSSTGQIMLITRNRLACLRRLSGLLAKSNG